MTNPDSGFWKNILLVMLDAVLLQTALHTRPGVYCCYLRRMDRKVSLEKRAKGKERDTMASGGLWRII